MRANKCDRCGKLFEKKDGEPFYIYETNSGPIIDLCNRCYNEIMQIFTERGTNEKR